MQKNISSCFDEALARTLEYHMSRESIDEFSFRAELLSHYSRNENNYFQSTIHYTHAPDLVFTHAPSERRPHWVPEIPDFVSPPVTHVDDVSFFFPLMNPITHNVEYYPFNSTRKPKISKFFEKRWWEHGF